MLTIVAQDVAMPESFTGHRSDDILTPLYACAVRTLLVSLSMHNLVRGVHRHDALICDRVYGGLLVTSFEVRFFFVQQ